MRDENLLIFNRYVRLYILSYILIHIYHIINTLPI